MNSKIIKNQLMNRGFIESSKEFIQAVHKFVFDARAIFKDNKVTAQIWSHREENNTSGLVCDFSAAENLAFSFIVYLGEINDFSRANPITADLTEAINFIGLITSALDAEVQIGLPLNHIDYCSLSEQ